MTTAELRADADRREALARAVAAGVLYGGRRKVSGADMLAFLDTADPAAVLASVERDRLLADAMEYLAVFSDGEAHKLCTRFATLDEAPTGVGGR